MSTPIEQHEADQAERELAGLSPQKREALSRVDDKLERERADYMALRHSRDAALLERFGKPRTDGGCVLCEGARTIPFKGKTVTCPRCKGHPRADQARAIRIDASTAVRDARARMLQRNAAALGSSRTRQDESLAELLKREREHGFELRPDRLAPINTGGSAATKSTTAAESATRERELAARDSRSARDRYIARQAAAAAATKR